ncbi:MAG: HepT-like ribonuclease domain-containing protein, partial [Patescibacteria group bacterium]
MKDDKVYIRQMLDAVRKIELFTANMNRVSFGADEKTQSAVIMQLMLIGEISKKISAQTKTSIDLPWKDIS